MPAQATVFIPENKEIEFDKLTYAFQQSWNWREAEISVRKCNYEILLTDLMSRDLDYKLRLEYFQKFITSIIEAMEPEAIWVSNTEKILNKEEYLGNFSRNDFQNLNNFMNVRLFNIQNSNNEMIMDTLGLNTWTSRF